MSLRARAAALLGLAVAVTGVQGLVPSLAQADPAGTGLVISEVYGGGGNSGAPYTNDFIELYNPTSAAISVAGMSVQYRAATGTSAALTNLTGSVPAGGHYLVQEASQAAVGSALPTPDATGTIAMSGSNGVVILASDQVPVTAVGNFAGTGAPADVVDTVGYGTTPTTFEATNTAVALTAATSSQRASDGTDTDANNPDFTEAAPTPANSGATGGGPVTPAALAVTSPGDKTAAVGAAITPFDVTATGGTPPYSYTATGLPAGLSISAAGRVSGTPTTAGAPTVTVTATDSAATPATANTTFAYTVTQPAVVTIAQVQGDDTDTSPLAGTTVTTAGVVTSIYSVGTSGAGFTIQTGGTPDTPHASDGLQVFTGTAFAAGQYPAIGDTVAVTGEVSEYFGLTEITPSSPSAVTATTAQPAPTPDTVLPGTDCAEGSCDAAAINTARELHESETYQPTAPYTVTDPYDGSPAPSTASGNFGEIGLAGAMSTPLIAATEDYDSQDQTAQVTARNAYNAAHEINIDDGSSLNFTAAANTGTPLPWFTPTHDVRVGAAVTFPTPVVLTWGNGEWRYEPQTTVTGDPGDLVTFAQTRSTYAGGPAATGGDLHLATFNVLNYFPTTGEDYVAGGGKCTYYTDRAKTPITDDTCTKGSAGGPRGAATAASLQRQQDKIVHAINGLGADVVSLEEIENSVVLGKDRDSGVGTLVAALNADAGAGTWAAAPSPATLPPTAGQDVIRTAFIYKPATVALVGDSQVLSTESSDTAPVGAFANAREPLAQAFKKVGAPDSTAFGVVVNHFKSKGSGSDDGTGQGNANPDRVTQANALLEFAAGFKAARGITKMFLVGDFNAYSAEDPVQKIEAGVYTPAAGGADVTGDVYTPINDTQAPIDKSYNFGGQNGSLDHIFANDAADATVTGADVWAINAFESIYYEYSRFNYNATDLYDTTPFRASDHNPEIVGINTVAPSVTLNLLNINDFHGRIDSAITPQFATKIEQLRKAGGEDNTLLLAAGDNIGATLFASANQQDNPTIDVLNALGLDSSSVGNHEFDQGFADLTGHVQDRATWNYLGANVYRADGTPALPEYEVFTVDGVKVGVIGAVTQETPSLVSPAGIAGLTFGDPVDAVNRVAAQLTDGDAANGEADVLVAEYHEGAPNGDVEKATLDSNLAASAVFSKIVNQTSPKVDAIFTGHTHKLYAYSAPVTGGDVANRPVLQTGNYGDYVGHVTLTYDPDTGKVTANTQENVARGTDTDLSFPRVQQVKDITDAAVAAAAQQGNAPVGTITADVTTAFTGGAVANGTYTGGTRDDRASESTLGDLVGNVLRDEVTVFNPGAPAPDLGIVNPGGLRAELLYAGNTASNAQNTDGVVTYAEANSVLPFSNNVYLVKLTGAQLETVLEQQYQTDASGNVPTRPYLQLGLSDNVVVTTDPTKPAGARITSVSISGQPLDPARTYTVSTFSFLAAGGDNFRAFSAGTSTDTGLLDAQLFRDYFMKHPGVAPDFARQQVTESGLPATVSAGTTSTFTLSKLDLTSQGSPANTAVTASIGGTPIGTFPVTDGTAAITLSIPASSTQAGTVVLTAAPSGTTVSIPLTGTTPPGTTPPGTTPPGQARSIVRAKVAPHRVVIGRTRPRLKITVTSSTGAPVDGLVRLKLRGSARTVVIHNGKVSLTLRQFGRLGRFRGTVTYLGTADVARSSDRFSVYVKRR